MTRTATADGFTLTIDATPLLLGALGAAITSPSGDVVGWGIGWCESEAIDSAIRAWNTTSRATVDKLRQSIASQQPAE